MAYQQRKIGFVGSAESNPETKPFWDGCARGKLVLPKCVDTGKFIWYPRTHLAFHAGEGGMGGGERPGKNLFVQRDEAGGGSLLHRLRDAG